MLDQTFPRRKRGKKLFSVLFEKRRKGVQKFDRQKLAFGIKGGQTLNGYQAKAFFELRSKAKSSIVNDHSDKLLGVLP